MLLLIFIFLNFLFLLTAWFLYLLRPAILLYRCAINRNFSTNMYLFIYLPVYQFTCQSIFLSLWIFMLTKSFTNIHKHTCTRPFISHVICIFRCIQESVLKRLHCFDAYLIAFLITLCSEMICITVQAVCMLIWNDIAFNIYALYCTENFHLTQQPDGWFEWQYSVSFK